MAGAVVTALLVSLALPNVYQSTSGVLRLGARRSHFGAVARSGGASTGGAAPVGQGIGEVDGGGAGKRRRARARGAARCRRPTPRELVDGVDADGRATTYSAFALATATRQWPQRSPTPIRSLSANFCIVSRPVRSQSSNVAIQASIEDLGRRVREAQTQMEGLLAAEHSPNVREEMQQVVARKAALEADAERLRARQDGIDQRTAVATEQLNKEATRSGALFSDYEQRLMRSVSDVEADLAAARVEFDGKQGRTTSSRVRALAAPGGERRGGTHARERSRLKQF